MTMLFRVAVSDSPTFASRTALLDLVEDGYIPLHRALECTVPFENRNVVGAERPSRLECSPGSGYLIESSCEGRRGIRILRDALFFLAEP